MQMKKARHSGRASIPTDMLRGRCYFFFRTGAFLRVIVFLALVLARAGLDFVVFVFAAERGLSFGQGIKSLLCH